MTLFFLCVLQLSFSAEGAFVLKTGRKKAIIHLQGQTVSQDAYFEAQGPKGRPRGLVQIKKTGKKKALARVVFGAVKKADNLKPVSESSAKKLIQAARRVRQRERKKKIYMRRMAAYRQAARKKRSSRKTRKTPRWLAAAENENYEAEGGDYAEEDSSGGSSPAESGDPDWLYESEGGSDAPMEDRIQKAVHDNYSQKFAEEESSFFENKGEIKTVLGVTGGLGWNTMTLEPIDVRLSGPGFEGSGSIDLTFNKKFSFTLLGGYKFFQIKNEEEDCNGDPCSLKVRYIKAGIEGKYLFLRKNKYDLWAGLAGALIWPHKVENYAGLTEESFGLHGTVGPALGANLKFDSFVLPLSLEVRLFNPPTKTVFSRSVFFNAGAGFRL